MKNSIWDILTGITLLGILCLIAGFGAVVMNPGLLGLNRNQPNTPGELVPTIAIPTETEIIPGLPPTWTPTPLAATLPPDSIPTLRPSSTPLPTNTPVILPTFTATKKSTTSGGGGGSGGVSGGVCSVVYQNPADNATMAVGQGFTTRWTLKNTSSSTWLSDSIDIRVASGTHMHTGTDFRDLPYSVGSQGMVDILIDMVAPSGPGTYTESWSLTQGLNPVCNFFVTIQVK